MSQQNTFQKFWESRSQAAKYALAFAAGVLVGGLFF